MTPRLSPRPNWDPLSRKRVCPPWNQKGGHTRLWLKGWGAEVPIPTTGEKAYIALCLLCCYYLDEYTPERVPQRSYNFRCPLTELRLHFI
jgi:hypothetical protein